MERNFCSTLALSELLLREKNVAADQVHLAQVIDSQSTQLEQIIETWLPCSTFIDWYIKAQEQEINGLSALAEQPQELFDLNKNLPKLGDI